MDATAQLVSYSLSDVIFIFMGITAIITGLLSTVTFFVTRQMTIKKMEGEFITVKSCEECKRLTEEHRNESSEIQSEIKEFLKGHANEFKVVRLALSELFAANGIPREKLDQLREDVFVNNKYQGK